MNLGKIVLKLTGIITILLGLYLLFVFPFSVPWYAAAPVELLGIAYIISGIHQIAPRKEEA